MTLLTLNTHTTMTPDTIRSKTTWNGTYKGLHFEITHWGVDCPHPRNNGKGCWNYYILLHEHRVANFSDLWFPNSLVRWSEKSPERCLVDDYYKSPLADVFWHGGVTFWESDNDAFPGHRRMKVGCDYNHLWNEENYHPENLQTLLFDAKETIDQLLDSGLVKLNLPTL